MTDTAAAHTATQTTTQATTPASIPEAQDPPAREVLTYEQFGVAARELAQAVVDSGFVPDVVVAVARGGLPLGGAIAYALGTKAVGTLNVEFYTGVDERLPDPVLLPPLLDTAAITGLRALVVDDVADTGETLALVEQLMGRYCEQVRTVVLYAKPRSVVDPHFVWKRTDRWIVFPWSDRDPVTRAVTSGTTPAEQA